MTMRVYFESDDKYKGIRAFPYKRTSGGPDEDYHDFKKNPELISKVLEDFVPWESHTAVPQFYEMLLWLNGADSPLETSDCALARKLGDNRTKEAFPKQLETSGRLMVLYRDLRLNTSLPHMEWLKKATHFHLNRLDPAFELGAVGLCLTKTSYSQLGGQLGNELVISFFAFGNNEQEVMENLERLFRNLYAALKCVSQELLEAQE
jgi:hypothetical protein